MGIKLGKFNPGGALGGVAAGGMLGIPGAIAGGTYGSGILSLRNSNGGQDSGPQIPRFDMKKTSDFVPKDPRIEIGGPNAASAMTRRFDSMRERVSQGANAALQGGTDAIKRRFAAQGASGSGAQIKAEMMAQNNAEMQKNDALSQVNEQQIEAELGRDAQQADFDFRQRVSNYEIGSKMHELDLAERQQQQDAVATEINARMAKEQMRPPKQGLISSLLGNIL